jgi:succinyl-CoA synthetase alpha subunit
MSVLVNKDSKIIVQGFTGSEGTFHASQMIEYGTNVVGGVTQERWFYSFRSSSFNTVKDAVEKQVLTQHHFFVPPAFAADAIMEAADAGIKVIIATEGIPVADMIKANAYVKERNARLVNCPGIITQVKLKLVLCQVLFSKKNSRYCI